MYELDARKAEIKKLVKEIAQSRETDDVESETNTEESQQETEIHGALVPMSPMVLQFSTPQIKQKALGRLFGKEGASGASKKKVHKGGVSRRTADHFICHFTVISAQKRKRKHRLVLHSRLRSSQKLRDLTMESLRIILTSILIWTYGFGVLKAL